MLLLSACLAACAARSSGAGAKGPEAPNEKVLSYEGALEVDALPQHSVEVRGGNVYVWGYSEAVCTDRSRDEAGARAEESAREELGKFVDLALQQLDLQFQSVGQESTSSAEVQLISQKVLQDVGQKLGRGERAHQKLEREGATLDRAFVRYSVPRGALEDAMIAGIGERPLKQELVHRVISSFDPDAAH